MPPHADRARETTTSTGTGNVTTAGAVSGFRTLAASFAVNEKFEYTIEGGAEFETGIGYLSASTTMVRETVVTSSNSNSLVSFSAGTKQVFGTLLGQTANRMRRASSLFLRANSR